MKKMNRLIFVLLILASVTLACGKSVPNAPASQEVPVMVGDCSSPDLTIMSDSNALLFLEDQAGGTKGLLSQFKEKTGYSVCVVQADGPEAVETKDKLLSKLPADFKPGDTMAFVFDSNMFADGLNDQAYLGSSMSGVWLHENTVNRFGLTKGVPLTMEQYANMMENGGLKIVTAPAYSSTPAAMMFFQTFSSYYGPNNQLSPDQVRDQGAIDYGKRIYDHYVRSATSTKSAVDMVVSDSSGLYDGVVGFESTFLGKNGKNASLSDPFIFFYFDPSVVSTITLGRLQLEGQNLEVYKRFAEFVTSEEAQIYIASTGIRPQKNVVDLSTEVFKPEWGLTTSPAVTFSFAPTYSVSSAALDIYRDYYKRAKVVKVLLDVSPSMFQSYMSVVVDGGVESVLRIQALDLALLKITDSSWLAANKILPGKDDVFEYYFFSTMRSDLVARTVGTNTDEAGDRFDYLLGPATGVWNRESFNQKMDRELAFISNGTAMFNASRDVLNMIEADFDPNVDYYIVILTDGEDGGDFSGKDFFYQWSNFSGKTNVTIIGIAFGTDGSSINPTYTAQFGGNTYMGDNDAGLVDAFKLIINR